MLNLFLKQKTAYEMRISDWSSDVCSSDLQVRDVPRLSADMHRLFDAQLTIAEREENSGRVRHERIVAGLRELVRNVDRKSAVSGKSASVCVGLGGRRIINKINATILQVWKNCHLLYQLIISKHHIQ